jgi:hypothetical protein
MVYFKTSFYLYFKSLSFREERVVKKQRKKKEVGWYTFVDKNDQTWYQNVSLNEMSVIEVFFGFHIV